MSIDGTSNRYAAYCRIKGLDPDATVKSIYDYSAWITARIDEYMKLNNMTKQEFYREEKIRIEGFTRFEMFLNERGEK